MLDSQTVRNVLGDDSVVGNPLSILPPLSSTGSGESQASEAAGGSAEGGAPQEKKKKRKGKGLKLAMRRMASFNLKQTKKARGEGEEEEVFGQEWFRITMLRGELVCDGFHQMSARG